MPATPPPIDPTKPTTFVVTDIEADGPNPLESSMLSFASVACDVTGKVLGEFRPTGIRPRFADRLKAWGVNLGGMPAPRGALKSV